MNTAERIVWVRDELDQVLDEERRLRAMLAELAEKAYSEGIRDVEGYSIRRTVRRDFEGGRFRRDHENIADLFDDWARDTYVPDMTAARLAEFLKSIGSDVDLTPYIEERGPTYQVVARKGAGQ